MSIARSLFAVSLAVLVSPLALAQRDVPFRGGIPIAPSGLADKPLGNGPFDYATGEGQNIRVTVLTKALSFPFTLGEQTTARDRLAEARRALGPMTTAEKRVTAVFVTTAAVWILGPLIQKLPGFAAYNDTTTALLAGLVMFVVPSGSAEGGGLLTGKDIRRVPWDVLLLFGGGLALAEAIQGSGLSDYLAGVFGGIGTLPLVALVATMVALLVFWTEFNSNVATAATFMPILAAIAAASDYSTLQLVAPAAMAASCGFMMPVGTPPNAIVFGTGRFTIQEMMRAGWRLNLAAIVVVTLVSVVAIPLID